MMRFDVSKPHGQLWGHSQAVYEQNGVLFDGSGEVVEQSVVEEEDSERVLSDNTIREFLTSQLSGGPVAQTLIYKEVENASLSWDEVKKEAVEMGIRLYKVKTTLMWSLI